MKNGGQKNGGQVFLFVYPLSFKNQDLRNQPQNPVPLSPMTRNKENYLSHKKARYRQSN